MAVTTDVEAAAGSALRHALTAAAGRTWPTQFFRYETSGGYMTLGGDKGANNRRERLAELYHERNVGVLVMTYHEEIAGRPHAVFEAYRCGRAESTALAVPIRRRLVSFKWDYVGDPIARPAPEAPERPSVPGGTSTRQAAMQAGLLTADGQWKGRVPKRLRQNREAGGGPAT
jgi:hypothetical protein